MGGTPTRNAHRSAHAALVALGLASRIAAGAVPTTVDDQPAQRYAHGSTSLLGGATLSAGLFGGSSSGTAFQAVALSGGLAVRRVTRFGLALEPRLGVDGFLVTGAAGLYALFAARLGLAAGWAIPLGRRSALTPMLSYEAIYLGGGAANSLLGVHHLLQAELPLAVFLGPRAFVEVFVQGGAASAFLEWAPAFAAG
jgi:hypothetical protein